MKNPNCDGEKCSLPNGEVRVLPTGGDGNAILCRACFKSELRWRRERNKELEPYAQFDFPTWEDLEIYSTEE